MGPLNDEQTSEAARYKNTVRLLALSNSIPEEEKGLFQIVDQYEDKNPPPADASPSEYLKHFFGLRDTDSILAETCNQYLLTGLAITKSLDQLPNEELAAGLRGPAANQLAVIQAVALELASRLDNLPYVYHETVSAALGYDWVELEAHIQAKRTSNLQTRGGITERRYRAALRLASYLHRTNRPLTAHTFDLIIKYELDFEPEPMIPGTKYLDYIFSIRHTDKGTEAICKRLLAHFSELVNKDGFINCPGRPFGQHTVSEWLAISNDVVALMNELACLPIIYQKCITLALRFDFAIFLAYVETVNTYWTVLSDLTHYHGINSLSMDSVMDAFGWVAGVMDAAKDQNLALQTITNLLEAKPSPLCLLIFAWAHTYKDREKIDIISRYERERAATHADIKAKKTHASRASAEERTKRKEDKREKVRSLFLAWRAVNPSLLKKAFPENTEQFRLQHFPEVKSLSNSTIKSYIRDLR